MHHRQLNTNFQLIIKATKSPNINLRGNVFLISQRNMILTTAHKLPVFNTSWIRYERVFTLQEFVDNNCFFPQLHGYEQGDEASMNLYPEHEWHKNRDSTDSYQESEESIAGSL